MTQELESKTVTDMKKFAKEYAMSGVQIYERTAKGLEGNYDADNCCMVTLPCKNKDKKLLILAVEIN